MHAKDVLAYARQLCRDIDAARPVRYGMRRVVLPLAIPTALGIGVGSASCGSSTQLGDGDEICDNGVDDDTDGRRDCADEDCSDFELCLTLPPGCEPRVEYCEDGIDNNENGATDCDDLCCMAYCFARDCPGCEYGVPFEPLEDEVDCADGRDEDCDGLTDCCDPDCALDPSCE